MIRLPQSELDLFLATISGAVELAEKGDISHGYEILILGLHRAERLRAEGEPWAKAVAAHYREAMDLYAQRYGVGRA